MLKVPSLALFILFLILVGGCGKPASPVETPSPQPGAKTGVKIDWQQKWDETVAAAKKEGQVRFAANTGSFTQQDELKRAFENRFGIELEIGTGPGAQVSAKIKAERTAGIYYWDVFSAGPTVALLDYKPANLISPLDATLILPEVTDPRAWRGGQLPYLDKEHTGMAYNSMFYRGALVNTDMVRPDQLTSLSELLKPEWRGKIVMDDIRKPGPGSPWLFLQASSNDYDFSKIREFLAQLVKQEPVITSDYRLNLEWVARGKYPVLVGYDTATAADFKAKGAPVTLARLKEGSVMGAFGPQNVSLPSGQLPHPNAAIVFINWLLSREGQAAFVKANASGISARGDVSSPGIDAAFLEFPGEKIYPLNEKMLQSIADLRKLAGEVLPK